MAGRTVVITGASDGIGAAAARALAADGEEVVVVGRSPEKTAAVAREVGARHHVADFARLDEVRDLAATLLAEHPRIDVLANNAGAILGARRLTVDGNEATLQVNHLAPFLLTHLLLGRLVASRASVVTTSSVAARALSRLDLEDLQNVRHYTPARAYGDSKLANVLMTRELHRRHGDQGLAAAAFHPGVVATNFSAESGTLMRLVYRTPLRRLVLVSPERGADTLLWLARGRPGADWQPGAYYERRRVARTHAMADDAAASARLWELSLELVGEGTTSRADRGTGDSVGGSTAPAM